MVATYLLLLGCGNGEINDLKVHNSSNVQNTQNSNTNNQLLINQNSNNVTSVKEYRIKKLPIIKESAIPKQVVVKKSATKQVEARVYREIGQRSEGFTRLHEESKFFYQQQLMMNMDLGYIDSIWEQINSYCDNENSCAIPENQITFKYTKALYNRDSKLIKDYELKTKDTQIFLELKKSLKHNIGKEVKLGAIELTTKNSSKYHYTLKTHGLIKSEIKINSIIKWNEDNSSFSIQETFIDTRTDIKEPKNNKVVSYSFDSNNETKINKFTYYENFAETVNQEIEFIEKEDGSIYFNSNKKYKEANLNFHAEGSLAQFGGDITYSVEGNYLHETFDENGIIQTIIKCFNPNTDIKNINEGDFCEIQDTRIIKNYLTSHIFTLSMLFININDFTPTSSPQLHSYVKFDTNNSMVAVVNCTTFRARYKIGEYGITFDNISTEVDSSLKCLYPYAENNFDYILKNGQFYNNSIDDTDFEKSHFDMAYGLWPNFDSQDRNNFDFKEFYKKLHTKKYIDSPLIDAVFHIKHTYFFSDSNYKLYRLSQDPQVIIEDNKIVIDILDAHFVADIEVVNPTHIKFNNIKRENKENAQYPNNDSCSNSEIGSDECIEDLLIDGQYSDRVFAKNIEEFLNETIEVSAASTDYKTIRFKGSNLIFEAVVAKY